jgi:hypothetical protein
VRRKNRSLVGRVLNFITGRPGFVVVVLAPSLENDETLKSDIAAIAADPAFRTAAPGALRVAGVDFKPRPDGLYYDDMFASFSADEAFKRWPAIGDLLARLGRGDVGAAGRVVQVDRPDVAYHGSPDLLSLLLIVLRTPTGSVLLDMKVLMLAAKMA